MTNEQHKINFEHEWSITWESFKSFVAAEVTPQVIRTRCGAPKTRPWAKNKLMTRTTFAKWVKRAKEENVVIKSN